MHKEITFGINESKCMQNLYADKLQTKKKIARKHLNAQVCVYKMEKL